MPKKLLIATFLFLGLSQIQAAEQCWEINRCLRVTGVGLGTVREDDERPHNIKQIAAMRAAKLDAVRSLAEQVKGIRLQSKTQSLMGELTGDHIMTETEGVLKGVRFVKVEPIQPGIYQAVAELDVLY